MLSLNLFYLLASFQLKHFLADYILQTRYHLGKFKPGWDFVKPLASHCLVHAILTFSIVFSFIGPINQIPFSLKMAVIDFIAHFVMDRIKAGPKYLGRFDDKNKPQFWWCLGLDQMVHHLVNYFIIYLMMTRTI